MLHSRFRSKKHDDSEMAIANFGLTLAKMLLVVAVSIMILITPQKQLDAGITPKVDAVIIVNWPAFGFVDVDTWVKTPNNKIVFFKAKEQGNVFLERDDLGKHCAKECEEIVAFRGIDPGEYILNLNVFNVSDMGPGTKFPSLPVHIKIVQLNPTYDILYEKDVALDTVKQELHIVRISAQKDRLIGFDETKPTSIMR